MTQSFLLIYLDGGVGEVADLIRVLGDLFLKLDDGGRGGGERIELMMVLKSWFGFGRLSKPILGVDAWFLVVMVKIVVSYLTQAVMESTNLLEERSRQQ